MLDKQTDSVQFQKGSYRIRKGAKMDDKKIKDIGESAWNYFSLHAEQRLKTFHFFIIFCAVIVGGLVSCLKSEVDYRICATMSLFLPSFSYIFYKLDQRNKQLIKHGENALKFLESQYDFDDDDDYPHKLKIFTCEEHLTKQLKSQKGIYPFGALFTYSTCINSVLVVFGLSGLIASLLFLIFG